MAVANSQEPIVIFEQVTFYRGSRAIFSDLNLEIQPGQVTAILGPSGTGKTTLLQLLGGLLRPDAGKIWVLGERVDHISEQRLYHLRKRMAMMFQTGALFTDLNVFDNVAFPLRQHTDLPEVLIRDVVLMKLEAVGLRGAAQLMPAQLSGGMARRVALARSIALDPELLMYDEPFTGQDPISMGILLKLIRTLNDALNLTSVVVTHDVNEILSIADYVYVIGNQALLGHGEPKSIQANRDPLIDQFIHGKPDGPVAYHYPAPSLAASFIEGVDSIVDS